MKKKDIITTKEFDKLFDEGKDISPYFDWSKATRPGLMQKRVNVDLPDWMVKSLDTEASRIGITRQSIIKTWLAEKLDSLKS